jgi:hypothetical protein
VPRAHHGHQPGAREGAPHTHACDRLCAIVSFFPLLAHARALTPLLSRSRRCWSPRRRR